MTWSPAVGAVIAERGASQSIRDRVADGQLAVGASLAQQAERGVAQTQALRHVAFDTAVRIGPPEAARSYEEMAERGAKQQGEGRI